MSDNSEFYTDELVDYLDSNNFPAMAGKPKFLFIDTSSSELASDPGLILPKAGNTLAKNGETLALEHVQVFASQVAANKPLTSTLRELSTPVIDEHVTKVACKSDFVILLASFPRYPALHNDMVGSIATRVLVEVFYKHSHKHHVTDLAMKVRRKLASKDLQQKKQVATTLDTLTKDFYIFPLLK